MPQLAVLEHRQNALRLWLKSHSEVNKPQWASTAARRASGAAGVNVCCGEDSWVWEQPAREGQETRQLKESLGKMPSFRG